MNSNCHTPPPCISSADTIQDPELAFTCCNPWLISSRCNLAGAHLPTGHAFKCHSQLFLTGLQPHKLFSCLRLYLYAFA
eukprot:1153806-Pelagomonas_calceolata.AAC.4